MVTFPDTRQSRQTHYRPFNRFVAGFLVLIPIIVFGYVWDKYAVSIPKWDDHPLRYFLFNLDNTSSVAGKLYEFFKQHNEHRIVYDRLITWLDFSLTGVLNYRHLMVIGNLSLIGLLIVFGSVLSRSVSATNNDRFTNGLLYLPPVAFLLLNLSHWENMFWGMAALQNFTVILWVFWSFYLLAFTQKTILAFVLAVAATLTSGNGLLIWPIGIAVLATQFFYERRVSRAAVLTWVIGGLVVIALYFLDYKKPEGNPPVRGTIVDLLKGWLAFTGAAAEAFPAGATFMNCLITGSIITVLVLGMGLYNLEKGLVKKKFSPFAYFFTAAMAFVLGTALIVTWSRASFGLDGLITSRYKLYSLLLLALIYSFSIVHQRSTNRTWAFAAGLIFSSILMASSYLTYLSETIRLRQWSITQQFNWTHNTNTPIVSRDSISSRYTELSPAFYDSIPQTLFSSGEQTTVPIQVTKTGGGYYVSNKTMPFMGLADAEAGTYLVARSPGRTYLFPVRQNQQSARKAHFQPDKLFMPGFQTTLSPDELDSNTYQLFILTVSTGKASLYPTHQLIESAGPPTETLRKNW